MFTVAQIEKAHENVKSGADFPKYIQEIKLMGVISFETWVSDSHTIYNGDHNFSVSSQAQYDLLTIAHHSDKLNFSLYLKKHQQGETDYFSFCNHCAQTGVEKWLVSLENMTCTYYDTSGTVVLEETIPH